MNGKEEYYNLIVCQEGGYPQFFSTQTDDDLIEKFKQRREDKYTYFEWNRGCIPMRFLIGITKQ